MAKGTNMTPLHKPRQLRRMRRDNPIPMTALQYARWLAKKPQRERTEEEIAAGLKRWDAPVPGNDNEPDGEPK